VFKIYLVRFTYENDSVVSNFKYCNGILPYNLALTTLENNYYLSVMFQSSLFAGIVILLPRNRVISASGQRSCLSINVINII
jgi:hypothetical protein